MPRADSQRGREAADIEPMISRMAVAQRDWATTPLPRRVELVEALANELDRRREPLARVATAEMSKPVAQAESEIDKCSRACRFFATHANEFLTPVHVATPYDQAYVQFDPLGIVLGVMPWNFPYWQVVRMLAPALLAGDAVLLKHASNVPRCAGALEDLVCEAGFPRDIFRVLRIPAAGLEAVIADPRISAVCATASSEAGAAVASVAGRYLKKQVLELGGSDPFIVLEDADLSTVVKEAISARMLNAGQSCVAAKRFILHEGIAEEFAERFAGAVRSLVLGDPWDRRTDVGPLARVDLAESLAAQVDASVAMGAQILVGGGSRRGAFYPPTVLTRVTMDMPVFAEETFGPVAALVTAATDEQAVDLANASVYGLAASIWTADVDRAAAMARLIHSGSVFVNCRVSSEPALPFGGVKRSGYGRELGSFGIRELTNIKAVVVRTAPGTVR